MSVKNILKQLIVQGEFLLAHELLAKIDKIILEELLFELGCDEQSLCAYSFICFLLLKRETVELHSLASGILNIAFCHLGGAYQTSLYHSKKAIELSPDDFLLKEALLFFNIIPEKIINDEEANKIAFEILQKIPTNAAALDILQRNRCER